MTLAALALAGWVCTLLALIVLLAARHALGERLEGIARASHELRGGIAAARLGMALTGPTGALEAPRLRAVELELDRAILALQELEGRPAGWTLEYVQVFELLTECVEAGQSAAAVRGSTLVLHCSGGPAVVIGDRIRLAQAISNLIANAIEHGGGTVEVRGSCAASEVRVEILDEGPGLPKPVPELTRHRRGRRRRGLGLAIAADIVGGHGGRLSAGPSARGARLMLELPSPQGLQGRLRAS